MSPAFHQNTLALIYDFDGTLTPKAMQEYTVLPRLGLDAEKFWREAGEATRAHQADGILTYMRLLVEKIEERREHLSRDDLTALADSIRYFAGVEGWFDRMRAYVAGRGGGEVALRQYVISAGLREIIEGTSIFRNFDRVYASEYFYDHHGRATWPNLVINDTNKTQFLFRINKGRENLEESINEHMPESDRPIPFQNMIYIGDGLTDVPCMNVVRKNGGYSVAVYNRGKAAAKETCRRLLAAGRVDFFAVADYREGRPVDRRIKLMLDVMIARVLQEKDAHGFRQRLRPGAGRAR